MTVLDSPDFIIRKWVPTHRPVATPLLPGCPHCAGGRLKLEPPIVLTAEDLKYITKDMTKQDLRRFLAEYRVELEEERERYYCARENDAHIEKFLEKHSKPRYVGPVADFGSFLLSFRTPPPPANGAGIFLKFPHPLA